MREEREGDLVRYRSTESHRVPELTRLFDKLVCARRQIYMYDETRPLADLGMAESMIRTIRPAGVNCSHYGSVTGKRGRWDDMHIHARYRR